MTGDIITDWFQIDNRLKLKWGSSRASGPRVRCRCAWVSCRASARMEWGTLTDEWSSTATTPWVETFPRAFGTKLQPPHPLVEESNRLIPAHQTVVARYCPITTFIPIVTRSENVLRHAMREQRPHQARRPEKYFAVPGRDCRVGAGQWNPRARQPLSMQLQVPKEMFRSLQWCPVIVTKRERISVYASSNQHLTPAALGSPGRRLVLVCQLPACQPAWSRPPPPPRNKPRYLEPSEAGRLEPTVLVRVVRITHFDYS